VRRCSTAARTLVVLSRVAACRRQIISSVGATELRDSALISIKRDAQKS